MNHLTIFSYLLGEYFTENGISVDAQEETSSKNKYGTGKFLFILRFF